MTAQPWRADLQLGAVRAGDGIALVVAAEKPWTGTLVFDRPRHAENLHLPIDWPRINQYPEWFTVQSGRSYRVKSGAATPESRSGAQLAAGLPVTLGAGSKLELTVNP